MFNPVIAIFGPGEGYIYQVAMNNFSGIGAVAVFVQNTAFSQDVRLLCLRKVWRGDHSQRKLGDDEGMFEVSRHVRLVIKKLQSLR